jgi:hypothetical protein
MLFKNVIHKALFCFVLLNKQIVVCLEDKCVTLGMERDLFS